MNLMKKIFGFFLMLLACQTLLQGQQRIFLWEALPIPNNTAMEVPDSIANERIFSVNHPSIDIYTPSKEENQNFAVLVIPGGGYVRSAHVASGVQIARYINTIGGTAVVLNYRLPVAPNLINRAIAPLQDAQRAIKWMRAHANEYNFESGKIGVFGTSAGGHLASMLGTFLTDYARVGDALDVVSCRPDFMVLLSPVIMLRGEKIHKGSANNLLGGGYSAAKADSFSTQNRVSHLTPKTLLFHADDDTAVPSENSVAFYQACRQAGVPASLHIFDKGGHKIALTHNPITTDYWKSLMASWLMLNVIQCD